MATATSKKKPTPKEGVWDNHAWSIQAAKLFPSNATTDADLKTIMYAIRHQHGDVWLTPHDLWQLYDLIGKVLKANG